MYGGSAHSGYHTGGHQPDYSPVLSADNGAQGGRPNWGRDLSLDENIPAAALTPEQAEQFKAQLGQLSIRETNEIYQMMHSEVPTAIVNYAPLGALGGTLDTSMPNSGNFLRQIPDAIKNGQDERGTSIVQLIESGTLTPGELMVLCDVMHNDRVQKMMESLNPAELAARGNFTINNYAIEKLQQRLFPDNPFALSGGDEKEEDEKRRLEDFAAACEEMNRTEAEKQWDAQMHRIGDMEFSGAELHAMWKYMNDPANDEEIIDAIMEGDPGVTREGAKKRKAGLKRALDLLEKERKGTISQAEREELDRLKKDKNIQKDLEVVEEKEKAGKYKKEYAKAAIVGSLEERTNFRRKANVEQKSTNAELFARNSPIETKREKRSDSTDPSTSKPVVASIDVSI